MALGDYIKVAYIDGSAPGISAARLNNNENKTEELDTQAAAHLADLVTDADGAHGLKMEEGTWTPILIGGTTNPTLTYVAQRATYTKIGKLISCSFFIRATFTGGSGVLNVGGFPVAIKDIDEAGVISKSSLGVTALNYKALSSGSNNLSRIMVYKDSNNYAQISEINTGVQFDIAGSIVYKIA